MSGCIREGGWALIALPPSPIDRFGALTILATNAGGGPKPFDMPTDDFRWAVELNRFSAFRLSRLAAQPRTAVGRGAILDISSMAGENRNVRMTSYCSSKAAVNHLLPGTGRSASGIRAYVIAPGAIRIDALADVLTPDPVSA